MNFNCNSLFNELELLVISLTIQMTKIIKVDNITMTKLQEKLGYYYNYYYC